MIDADGLVTKSEREQFAQDGVVCLRQRFEPEWIEMLADGIDSNMLAPSPLYAENRSLDGKGRYCEDTWIWQRFPQFRKFIFDSPAAQIAARLLSARRINLVMDLWMYREAGTQASAPWHHDISYMDIDGRICVLWLPLDPVTSDSCVAVVRGSHLWNKLFLRVWFKDHSVDGEPGWINGQYYEAPPDIDNHPQDYDIAQFDMQPGDALVFDIRALHGFPRNVLPTSSVRRFTLRMCAEDGVLRYRGDWAERERRIIEAAGHKNGDAMCSEFFPTLFEESSDFRINQAN